MLQGCRLEVPAAAQEQTFPVRSLCANTRGVKRITTYMRRLQVQAVGSVHVLRCFGFSALPSRQSEQRAVDSGFLSRFCNPSPRGSKVHGHLLGLRRTLLKLEDSRRSNLNHLVQLVLPLSPGPAGPAATGSVHSLLR